jgi:hypothetical protein
MMTGGTKWLGVVTLATLLLIEVPYLLAYAQEARGFVFTGMLWSPHDFSQYAAAMREGAATTSWLIHDHLTAEPHAPAFMYPLYVGLGKLAGLLRLDVQAVYHGAEIVARAILLIAVYRFCAEVFSGVGERRLAFTLVVFSSGLAFWVLLLQIMIPIDGIRGLPLTPEHSRPEVSTFLVLFTAPHLMLGLAFLLLAAGEYLGSWTRPGLRTAASTSGAVFGLGLTNPFGLVTLCVVLVGHLIVMRLRRHHPPRSAWLSSSLAMLVAIPFLLYNLLVFGGDPFWGVVYGAQNLIPSPPAPVLAMGFAPVLALAALGLPGFVRAPGPGRWLVVVWIALSLALICIPTAVGFQRRFVFGVQPMLGLVAAVGLTAVWRWARCGDTPWRAFGRRMGRHLVMVTLFSSTVCFYGRELQIVTRPAEGAARDGAFHSVALREAGQWLATVMGPHDVVLAEAPTGNYLAGVTIGRVFVGHPIGTLGHDEKRRAAWQFYLGMHDEAGHSFLAANNIRYVVYGPHERALGAALPSAPQVLRAVYETPEVSIYEVERVAATVAAP